MHAILKKAALAAALATASLSAHAVETKITVYADVDPTLALLRDDGSALPDAVTLTHDPLRGLIPDTQHVRIHSNDSAADIEAKIGGAFVLANGDGTVTVPMKVCASQTAVAATTRVMTVMMEMTMLRLRRWRARSASSRASSLRLAARRRSSLLVTWSSLLVTCGNSPQGGRRSRAILPVLRGLR